MYVSEGVCVCLCVCTCVRHCVCRDSLLQSVAVFEGTVHVSEGMCVYLCVYLCEVLRVSR